MGTLRGMAWTTADIPARFGGGRCRVRSRARVGGRTLVGCAVAGLVVLGAACTGPPGTATPSTTAVPSTTAAPPAGPTLRTTALTLDELRARKGNLGYDVREQPVVDPEQFDLGQLRLACGDTVALPFRSAGEHKVYRSSLAVVVEVLGGGLDRPTAVVERAGADLRAGCPPVATRWSGQPVTATYEAPVSLTVPGVNVAWTESWVTGTGGNRYRYAALAAHGDRLTVLDLVVDIRLEPDLVRSLVASAMKP
jgi:hypothetical protein